MLEALDHITSIISNPTFTKEPPSIFNSINTLNDNIKDFTATIKSISDAIAHPFITLQNIIIANENTLYFLSASIVCIAILYSVLTEDKKKSRKWIGGTFLCYLFLEIITLL